MTKTILYNEDCSVAMKKIGIDTVNLILTDPPYNLGVFMKNVDRNLQKMRDNFLVPLVGIIGSMKSGFQLWIIFFAESARIIKKGGSMIVFMSLIKVETIIQLAIKHGKQLGFGIKLITCQEI